jgi:uncharacterized membrane protein (DUF2068 family)
MSARRPGRSLGRVDSRGPMRLAETARNAASGIAWGLVLVIFMRLLAMLWVVQGLLQWVAVLLPQEALFDHVSALWSAAVMFFAVFDLVAAVGLWLATPWGGVIWLFGALAQILAAVAIPGFFSLAWISADILLIGTYFGLTWLAGQSDLPRS